MIQPRLMYAATLCVGFLTGCNGGYVAPSLHQVDHRRFAIVADAETIHVGGTTTLTITAKNHSSVVMEFGRGSSSCWFELEIVNKNSGRTVSFNRACTKDYADRYLEPGEVHSETVTWRARMRVGDEIVDVPPGEYQFRAVANGSVGTPITITVLE